MVQWFVSRVFPAYAGTNRHFMTVGRKNWSVPVSYNTSRCV
ncbi:hypothetical protein [Erwinia amylovora]